MTRPTGRFAPTPSGPLHFGSLLTAVASYLDIKSKDGTWLVRIDDLDESRTNRELALGIIEMLERHGLTSDAPPVWQSERGELYADAINRLRASGHLFQCACSRKSLRGLTIYPGTCRYANLRVAAQQSTRFIVPNRDIRFEDEVQGGIYEHLTETCGDFVVIRRDGFVAYHLATVVDDADLSVSHVVRGADLLVSTARQISLANALDVAVPNFAHLPVVLDREGRKASKSLAATPVSAITDTEANRNLAACMQLLGLNTPRLSQHSPESLLDWARRRFELRRIPRVQTRSDFLCL